MKAQNPLFESGKFPLQFRLQISVTLFGYEFPLHFLGPAMETMLHALQFPAKILEKDSNGASRWPEDENFR